MIVQIEPDEITTWFLAFYGRSSVAWLDRLVPGRFKHVSAFGYSHGARVWVFYDFGFTRARVFVLPAGERANAMLGEWTAEASVLKINSGQGRAPWLRLGFWCVPAMRHLVGVRSGALLPDGLWRDCLQQGAGTVFDGRPTRSAAGRPGTGRAETGG